MVCRVDQLGLVADRPIGIHVIAPDAAVGRALPFDDVELLLVRRECETVGVDKIRDRGGELAVRGKVKYVRIRLLWLLLVAFPIAQDAEQRIGKPDALVGFDYNVVRRIQPFALEPVGEDRDLAVLLRTCDAARD